MDKVLAFSPFHECAGGSQVALGGHDDVVSGGHTSCNNTS